MVQPSSANHHQHIRKRLYKNKESIPHKDSYIQFLDKAIYTVGMIGPLLLVPQVIKIYREHNASSISLFTWTVGIIPLIIWMMYGYAHKEKPIIIVHIAWLLIYLAIVIGKIIY